ncbi:basic helix-loop-helix transcription factor scleraxis-like [Venturia canescens]|uniref:basic helix-loop-helix transcription factor scleraxis-like n=1 Tax=Venturia canescens TaxID=32260 RepID=UPI001C9CE7E3|nr:basic helix-loop-helix transcription factor scleraxis-like [Venturia canescens]
MMESCKADSRNQRFVTNARERDRNLRKLSLCSVNTAYTTLRTLIPTEPVDRKLSKIETLRLATGYISHLHAILVAECTEQPCSKLKKSSFTIHETRNNDWTQSTKQLRTEVCIFCLAMNKKYASTLPSV